MKHSITAVVGPKVQLPKGAPKPSGHPHANLGPYLHPPKKAK